MDENIDIYWSGIYDKKRDFTRITYQEISNFLRYTDPNTQRACLDIGCGTGQLSRELFHRGYRVVGLDASSTAVKIARSLSVIQSDQLEYAHLNIEHDDLSVLPLNQYSLITCRLVYTFIKDKARFLQKINQLLTPGGLFVVITVLKKDVPPEKAGIATSSEDMKLLLHYFKQVTVYKEYSRFTYFIGTTRQDRVIKETE